MTTIRKVIFICFVLHMSVCYADYFEHNNDLSLIQTEVDFPFQKDVEIDNLEAPKCICPKFPRPSDCSEVLANGHNVSGVYTIYPKSRAVDCDSIQVYCDMETDGGGWTVIQRRGDYGNGPNYFVKNWNSYKKGFGNLRKEFWLGNDNIFAISNQDSYSVRFDLKTVKGDSGFALWDTFFIDEEDRNYRLHLEEYSGTATAAINNHHLTEFYTLDRPNFPSHRKAGDKQHKGGWWNNGFPSSNLNGLNKQGKDTSGDMDGIVWFGFGEWGFTESLGHTEIKVRPKRFK
ncbi:hypothetical protein JTE90_004124 [Oedothorax gibbosus]|uniref:Fibrinogen C-terminal domain-containing protein n=2 Tax=Oedothorax gibbosus TaxID=931172 RepID=A0AAV6V3Y1_9ARAC|nr:hypothetical protein JTE90_004124 [Oedothorax gibbosus]